MNDKDFARLEEAIGRAQDPQWLDTATPENVREELAIGTRLISSWEQLDPRAAEYQERADVLLESLNTGIQERHGVSSRSYAHPTSSTPARSAAPRPQFDTGVAVATPAYSGGSLSR